MKFLKQTLVIGLSALALSGCGSDSNPTPTAGAAATTGGDHKPVLVEKLFVSVAELGEIKSIHLMDEEGDAAKPGKILRHVSAPTTIAATIDVKSTTVPDAQPGEMRIVDGNVYIRLSNSENVQMIDVASDGIDHNHPMTVGSRPVHMFVDQDEKVWVLNDGPRTASGVNCVPDPAVDAACNPDTVSVIDKGGHDPSAHITVGSGHHKAAFSHPSATHPNVPKRAFVSNIHDDTISVIDNDPSSGTYLQVVSKDLSLNGDASLLVGDNPHGIDFSPVSGKIYNVNTRDGVNAVSVIDATTLAQTFILKGSGTNQVPATSRLHTRHAHGDPSDGQYVYILGSLVDDKGTPDDPTDDTTTGVVSVIDTFANDAVTTTEIPGVRPSRMLFSPDGKRFYVASGTPFSGDPTPDLRTNVVMVLDIDPTSANFNKVIAEITVGTAGSHGSSMAISGDGHLLFVANAGEPTVSIIDTESNTVVETLNVGGVPSGIAIGKIGGAGHDHG